jgi:small-conductance mechanosensitive channel
VPNVEGLPNLLAALALWIGIAILRRSMGQRGVAKQFLSELAAAQRLFAVYLLLRLALLGVGAMLHPSVGHALDAASMVSGAVGVLRLLDGLAFGFIRWRGRHGLPRILRSLLIWVATFLCIAVVVRVQYKMDLSSLFATSALLSVVIGFALQETLGNLFAGLTLHAEQPFETGEWVTFGKYTGRIVDVGWRSTRLLTLDDDELLVPNSLISREVVVNHMRPQLTDVIELLIPIDLEVSPARAKRVLLEAVRCCSAVLATPEPRIQLASFSDNAANYRVRFATSGYHLERWALDQVQEAIWYSLRREAIDMPYPQTTLSFRERAAEADDRRRREHLAEAEDLLGRIDFVKALNEEARRTLAGRARFLEYGPGQAIVRQGEEGETLYLVARGEVAVVVKTDGGEKEVARLGRGALFGEMSVLTGEPRSATVTALGDAALLGLDREAFHRILDEGPELAQRLAEVIAGRRLMLDAARAEGTAPLMEKETASLLGRIGAIFGFKQKSAPLDRATGT